MVTRYANVIHIFPQYAVVVIIIIIIEAAAAGIAIAFKGKVSIFSKSFKVEIVSERDQLKRL